MSPNASSHRSTAAARFASLLVAILSLISAEGAFSQTTPQMVLDPWTHEGFGETTDRLLYQAQADIDGSSNTTQIFWWDSIGRFRLSPTSDADPRIAYRYLTIATDSYASTLPDTLDELSLAYSMSVGDVGGGELSFILGAGYSGDNLFADANGLYGIGHLIWRAPVNATDTFALLLDYNGSDAFLPDVPLPGFAYTHQQDNLIWTIGYPRSEVQLSITETLHLAAGYAVPYTADVTVEQQLGNGISVYGGYYSFCNAFFLDDEPREDRFFLEMQRVEIGVRYINGDVLGKGLYLDAGLSVGYVLEQSWSRGFDVRDLEAVDSTEAVPYVGLNVRGRF